MTRPPAGVTVDQTSASLSRPLPGNVTSRGPGGHLRAARLRAVGVTESAAAAAAEAEPEWWEAGRRCCVLTMLSRAARSDTLLLGLSDELPRRYSGAVGSDIEMTADLVRSGAAIDISATGQHHHSHAVIVGSLPNPTQSRAQHV